MAQSQPSKLPWHNGESNLSHPDASPTPNHYTTLELYNLEERLFETANLKHTS